MKFRREVELIHATKVQGGAGVEHLVRSWHFVNCRRGVSRDCLVLTVGSF